jgi:uncharacterized protein
MLLTEHHNEQQLFVRRVEADAITVIDRRLTRSFALNAQEMLENLPAQSADQLDAAAIEKILALQPEVVLLGTGQRAGFPPQAVVAEFLKRGIGLESMDNAAAARTFNVLVGEGRQAVGVFLLPG